MHIAGWIAKNVSKTFIDKKAVDNISFRIEKPGLFALLGTNGAGKTTTIRMMLGIIKKDSGIITWNGKEVDRKSVNFGYLPEERGIYPKTRIIDQLQYFAQLKGMNKEEAVTFVCGSFFMSRCFMLMIFLYRRCFILKMFYNKDIFHINHIECQRYRCSTWISPLSPIRSTAKLQIS